MIPAACRTPRSMRALLARMFGAAVRAAGDYSGAARLLPPPPPGRTCVIAAGKAALPMARALVSACSTSGHRLSGGLVVVPHGCARSCGALEVIGAGHPVPDAASERAGKRALDMAHALDRGDLLLAAFSGGGSSLLCVPAAGLGIRAKRAVNLALLRSGLAIGQMNCVRAQLSQIKGGRLALAARPADVATFVASDVPGDDPALIASGPTSRPAGSAAAALAVVERAKLRLPARARAHLQSGARAGKAPPRWRAGRAHVLVAPQQALAQAAQAARSEGIRLHGRIELSYGDAEEEALRHARLCERLRNGRAKTPAVIVSGGETTVKVRRSGRGGRNTTFLLRLALELDGFTRFQALAADTDGIDGTESNAGAYCDGRTAARLRRRGLDPTTLLRENRAYDAFEALGDLFVTGPTGTNVNDLRAILVA